MFGKRLTEYLGFQKVFLGLIAVVGLARLGLSLAGVPDSTAKWISMTVVVLAGAIYYGVSVHVSGFGGYKQLLPLVLFQVVLVQAIAVFAIVLSIAGLPNVFTASEYSGPFAQNQWAHLAGHLTIGMVVPTLATWGLASLVMLLTKKVVQRPAIA